MTSRTSIAARRPILRLMSIAAALAATPAFAAELSVTLEGVEARDGTLYVSVQTEAEFMSDRGVAGTVLKDPAAGSHAFTFDVPAGVYAVSVWHDDNGNGTFDNAPDGMPIDGWAMSGDLAGPPAFADVAVNVPEGGAAIVLGVQYGN